MNINISKCPSIYNDPSGDWGEEWFHDWFKCPVCRNNDFELPQLTASPNRLNPYHEGKQDEGELFTATFKCKSCHGNIVMLGRVKRHSELRAYPPPVDNVEIDEDGMPYTVPGEHDEKFYLEFAGDPNNHYEAVSYEPLYIFPPLAVFDIPAGCPDEIKAELTAAFAMAWSDLQSCANRIRVSVELLLDFFEVPRTAQNPGSKTSRVISLHKRIVEFKAINNTVSDLLMAIKWIGNDGSHNNTKLEKSDIHETFEIMEFALERLFGEKDKAIREKARNINMKKWK